jgi:hypothetical protein
MLYIPKQKTKIYLLVLCGLILFHISFLSSKSYTAHLDEYRIINGTEEQYQSCLYSLPYINNKLEFIANTEIEYLFNLPEQSLFFIYLGYFLIASGFILSAKINLNESDNGNK